jgi:hypothetical protein
MRQAVVERRLFDLSARLAKAREELALLDTQLEVFDDMASQAQVTSVVRDDRAIYAEARRHLDAMRGARETLCGSIARIEAKQERLIARLTSSL